MQSSNSAPSVRASRAPSATASAPPGVARYPTTNFMSDHHRSRTPLCDVPRTSCQSAARLSAVSTQSAYSTTPSSSTSRAFEPSGFAASVRNTACPGSVRQIEVVSVSPGKTGEVNRDAIAVTFVASPPPSSATQRATGDPVGAQPVQDRLGEAGQLAGEPRVAVQRIAVAGQPVDQRLVLAGGQRDRASGSRSGISGATGRWPGWPPKPPSPRITAVDIVSAMTFAGVGVGARRLEHHDGVLALALVLDVGDLADHAQLPGRRQRLVQPDLLGSVQQHGEVEASRPWRPPRTPGRR